MKKKVTEMKILDKGNNKIGVERKWIRKVY